MRVRTARAQTAGPAAVCALEFTRAGRLVCGSDSGAVTLGGEVCASAHVHEDYVRALAWCDAGAGALISGGWDRALRATRGM